MSTNNMFSRENKEKYQYFLVERSAFLKFMAAQAALDFHCYCMEKLISFDTEAHFHSFLFPAVGEYCVSYGTKCADPHASCYNRECTCRAGYHPKYGVCRKS